jgi:amino acid transporter
VVFSIFAFTGWEGAAAIAEETQDPRRQIPRAIVGSVLLLGVFYVFCAWGLQLGWGVKSLDRLAETNELPAFAIGHRLWGAGWVLVLLALFNSAVSVCIACTVDSTRNWYAMARAGTLPKFLARVHPVHRTPSSAVQVQFLLAVTVAFALAGAVGPDQAFFVMGLVGTLMYVVVYCLGNIGVVLYFLRVRRAEFRLSLHLLLPVVSSLALLAIAFASLYPLPEPPVRYAPAVIVALSIAGALVLWRLRAGGTDWQTLSQHVVER